MSKLVGMSANRVPPTGQKLRGYLKYGPFLLEISKLVGHVCKQGTTHRANIKRKIFRMGRFLLEMSKLVGHVCKQGTTHRAKIKREILSMGRYC